MPALSGVVTEATKGTPRGLVDNSADQPAGSAVVQDRQPAVTAWSGENHFDVTAPQSDVIGGSNVIDIDDADHEIGLIRIPPAVARRPGRAILRR